MREDKDGTKLESDEYEHRKDGNGNEDQVEKGWRQVQQGCPDTPGDYDDYDEYTHTHLLHQSPRELLTCRYLPPFLAYLKLKTNC